MQHIKDVARKGEHRRLCEKSHRSEKIMTSTKSCSFKQPIKPDVNQFFHAQDAVKVIGGHGGEPLGNIIDTIKEHKIEYRTIKMDILVDRLEQHLRLHILQV